MVDNLVQGGCYDRARNLWAYGAGDEKMNNLYLDISVTCSNDNDLNLRGGRRRMVLAWGVS